MKTTFIVCSGNIKVSVNVDEEIHGKHSYMEAVTLLYETLFSNRKIQDGVDLISVYDENKINILDKNTQKLPIPNADVVAEVFRVEDEEIQEHHKFIISSEAFANGGMPYMVNYALVKEMEYIKNKNKNT